MHPVKKNCWGGVIFDELSSIFLPWIKMPKKCRVYMEKDNFNVCLFIVDNTPSLYLNA